MDNNNDQAQYDQISTEPNPEPNQLDSTNQTQAPAVETIATPNTTPKKKHTGLIISCIIALFVLLGGGTILCFAIMNSSPANMLLSSLRNLFSSAQVVASGNLELTLNYPFIPGAQSINLEFNAERAEANQQTEANLKINYVDGTSTDILSFGNIMLQNGIFYLRINGLNKFYQESIRSTVSSMVSSLVTNQYRQSLYESCYYASSYSNCIQANANNPLIIAQADQKTSTLMSELDTIIAKIDNQWYEFSIEDILNSDFFKKQLNIPDFTKQGIISTYNCSINVINQVSNYSDEFSKLYENHPFINLTATSDNYYNVSIDANQYADYYSNVPNLTFYKDLSNCINATAPVRDSAFQVSAEEISPILDKMPNVAVRFDNGLFDHHLTDITISQTNDYYDLSIKTNITYQSNHQVSAPNDAQPIMELVQDIYTTIITALQN